MRLALLLTVTISCAFACSTSGKHEDSAPMPPPAKNTADAPPYTGAKVVLSAPNGDVEVNVEVVASEAKIQKGLMYRSHLPVDAGMLFMMGVERVHSFWMRNTLIPLDIIFIGKDMTVVGISENAEPLTESLRTVGKPSFYVLEVNGGWSKQHGVGAGTKVRFDNMPSDVR